MSPFSGTTQHLTRAPCLHGSLRSRTESWPTSRFPCWERLRPHHGHPAHHCGPPGEIHSGAAPSPPIRDVRARPASAQRAIDQTYILSSFVQITGQMALAWRRYARPTAAPRPAVTWRAHRVRCHNTHQLDFSNRVWTWLLQRSTFGRIPCGRASRNARSGGMCLSARCPSAVLVPLRGGLPDGHFLCECSTPIYPSRPVG